jgi:glycosyltransferase involved in cell wall biosynthesis
MRALFIHQNFPGQFKHLAPALAARGDEVHALAITPRAPLPGVTVHRYARARTQTAAIHPWLVDLEASTIRAEACASAMHQLKQQGLVPDLVVGHPAWGETWLVKDIWPKVPVLAYQEFWYGADAAYDPEFGVPGQAFASRVRMKNAWLGIGLENMDWGISPTHFQHAQFPAHHRARISVIFDGIDTDALVESPHTEVRLNAAGRTLTRADEVLTYVSRGLEPYRGYHTFVRALPAILRARPRAQVVIVGGDATVYGAPPPAGSTWRERFWNEVKDSLDTSRVHFLGSVPHPVLHALLSVSRCHVYLTVPFVLSWSMLEAMAFGCLVLGSRTPPVEEVIRHRENGLLTDFFDAGALAERAIEVLRDREAFDPLRRAARETVRELYDLKRVCLPAQLSLVDTLRRAAAP